MKVIGFLPLASAACALLFVSRSADPPTPPQNATGGLVTLYANDDLMSSFNFASGSAGGRVDAGEVLLDRAQIAFDVFQRDSISFGFGRGQYVNVIDLGAEFISPHDRAQDAVKIPASLFHTLFLDGRRFSYVGPGGKVHRLREAGRIFDALPPEGMYHLPIELGHTYLVRYQDVDSRGEGELAKFQVVDYLPESRLTIRWAKP